MAILLYGISCFVCGKEVSMENSYFWEKFQQTGNITDYLNYTACTSEESQQIGNEEGDFGGNPCDSTRNGVSCHASWRL